MKIAILTSGILPVPAVQGGAVENLIDFYLAYNNQHRLHNITVFSVWHHEVENHPALQSEVNHYIYIKVNGWRAKFKKRVYQKTHGKEYYHYTIEYYLEQALKRIKQHPYDLIILENRPGYALKLKGETNARMVCHLHNDMLNSDSRQGTDIYQAISKFITVSDYVASRVRTIAPTDNKCVTVHNGIDIKAFSSHEKPQRLAALSNDDFVIVYSGRINQEKGIMELIEAMNIIGNQQPIKLIVMGSSFYGNATNKDPFTCILREKAEPIKDRIIFTGYIPYSDIPGYLHMADIAVLPSMWEEPFGLTMAEAQAAGLPIITTRRGGIPEVVTEQNAIILETGEQFVNNLAAAILDLYQHPGKREQMSKASLEHSKNYSHLRYAKDFFDAISK